ncbi:LytR/AlgR family response regulator transcription factor [Thomasclavelia spiroformis]|uniref:LytR/AlgR family response regulator transcription factor n=1 Tax=Thomasclavelia spiroformis TaxID=29348 RepID=UPI00241C2B9C|nr:LytTR family DNA-binding domain-containing protein [Thomasclavelia spiroformis]MBS6115165.1 LytTR family transcriptional regulator [Thomasclavelia spiroformis]
MYKVAVINHNDEIYCIINDTFKNYGIETDITCFNDFMNIKKIFDFLFINVDISNLNNIQFIKKYLSIHNNALIIIINDNYDSLFNYGDLHFFDFIKKDSLYLGLTNSIKHIVSKINEQQHFITINNKSAIINIACNEIIFCKSQGHTCFIYTNSDTYQTTKYKLSMLEQFINSCDFYMINRSCLINWNYVYKIAGKNIVLKNKTILKISKNRYKNVLLAYQKYLKRNLI